MIETTKKKAKNENDIKAIEGLRSYKIGEKDEGKTHEGQLCKLGGYCYNNNGHEESEAKKNGKSFNEERGERDYNYGLLAQEGRTFRVSCECMAVKEGDERLFYVKFKRAKTGTNYGWYCEKHSQEKADYYIENGNEEKNKQLSYNNKNPVLAQKPIGVVDFYEVKKKVEELYKKPFRT